MTIKSLKLFALLALSLSPALAFAKPMQTIGAHQRPMLFHDRSPKLHDHGTVAHH